MFLTDRQVASILREYEFPEADIQEWPDYDKNVFTSAYIRRMTENDVAELITESAYGCWPGTVAKAFTDPLAYANDIAETLYIYLEPEMSDLIASARSLMDKEVA